MMLPIENCKHNDIFLINEQDGVRLKLKVPVYK